MASFALGQEMIDSPMVKRAQQRLAEAGVRSYQFEVAGAGSPELELDGATYIGEREINWGIELFLADNDENRAE